MYHSLLGNERSVPGLLDDQVMVARALLDSYEVTGDPTQLARARQDHGVDNPESLGCERGRLFR